ncbi:MAG: YitT family protein [Candidatus Kapaibacterium sp.]
MRFSDLQTHVHEFLHRNMDAMYAYHSPEHTLRVDEAASRLAKEEGLDEYSTILVRTAALVHDIGYTQGREGHEERSAGWARNTLPQFGYDMDAIENVCAMVLGTTMPQKPVDLPGEILCDADLENLGSASYQATAELMRKEYASTRAAMTDEEWLQEQVTFFESHRYHTESARRLYGPQAELNLQRLRNELAKLRADATAASQKTPTHEDGGRMSAKEVVQVVIGVIMASIALKSFLVPNRFFDGGVTGLSLLVHELNHQSLGLLIVLFNIPAMIVGYLSAGKRFALGMLAGVLLLGVSLELMPSIPATGDKLLVAVFGGAFLGIGVGLAMRAGAALDGIEVLALYTLRRTGFSIAEIILGINILIFAIAALSFGVETALYSILTYFTASRCIDYVVEGLEAFTGVTIISARSEQIKHHLVNHLGRGITVYKGERGYLPGSFHVRTECDIIFTVITRLELRKLKNLIAEIDPQAFVFASAIRDASGGVLARKHRH